MNNIKLILLTSIAFSNCGVSADTDVHLECRGKETSCYVTSWGEKVCQPSVDVYHPIMWSGSSIKHLNYYATLEFKDKCLISKQDIKCYENNGATNYAELIGGNVRTLNISRESGSVEYQSTYELKSKSTVKFGATHEVIAYSGKCYPRTSQYLF